MSKRLLIRRFSIIICVSLVIVTWDADISGAGVIDIVASIVLILSYSIALYLVFQFTKPKQKNKFFLPYMVTNDYAYAKEDAMTEAEFSDLETKLEEHFNIKENRIDLTVEELISALTLCGHDQPASQILHEQNLITNEAEFTNFVQEAETGLQQKGYWEEDRDSSVASVLEDLLDLLVHSKKKVYCMANQRILLIYSLINENSLVQEIRDGKHSFYLLHKDDGFRDILREHYGMADSEISVEGWQPIEMSEKLFNEFHTSEPAVLQAMIDDEAQLKSVRDFARDFLKNDQKFDNITYIGFNDDKNQSELDQVALLLPSDDYIWHLEYSMIKAENKVQIAPIPVRSYFEEAERVLIAFFKG